MSDYVGSTTRTERALMSVLSAAGLLGARATGQAVVHATGPTATIPAGSYAVPLIGAPGSYGTDPSLLVKVADPPVTITNAGTVVDLVAMTGGAAANLPAGTVLRWSPTIAGVEATSVVADAGGGVGMTGGAAPSGVGTAQRIVSFEGVGKGPAAETFWAAAVGAFPALVVSWEGAGEAQRLGRGRASRMSRYRIYVVTTRLDGDNARRDEGKALLDAVGEVLCDRAAADGEVFSAPPLALLDAGRLVLPGPSAAYIYWQEIRVAETVSKLELRSFGPWTSSRERGITPPDDAHPAQDDAVVIVDQSQDMT